MTSSEATRSGRRNYRLEQSSNGVNKLDYSMTAQPLNWSAEVERCAIAATGGIDTPTATVGEQQQQLQNGTENKGYQTVESPSIASLHSEVSADSGRATGGMASSMSPVEELCDVELMPMYEFEIPNTLVGLIIGIKCKTIKELCQRADVKMIIRQHHTPAKVTTHQICTVEGKRENINRCLQMLRRRFPPSRFPELNLKPVLPPPIPSPASEMFGSQPTPLTLPESVRCEVVLSSMVDAGHFFLQQPTHPSFSSLQRLDYYMLGIYSQTAGIPELPKPCETNLLCVAPALNGWYRAVTVIYYEEHDEVLVRFVDYGGYSRIPRADLRQIRTDFMTLPFQATECYLAHVIPADGHQWTDEANELFQSYAMSKVIEANIVAYHAEDRTPMVELFTTDVNNQPVQIHRILVEHGFAKYSDDTLFRRSITCSKVIDDDDALSN
jgi:A-kinase anchor protein 1